MCFPFFCNDFINKIAVDLYIFFCTGCFLSGINSLDQGFYHKSDGVLDGSEWINKADIDLLLRVSTVAFLFFLFLRARERLSGRDGARAINSVCSYTAWRRWQAVREALTRIWIDLQQNATSWFNFIFWNNGAWALRSGGVLTAIMTVIVSGIFDGPSIITSPKRVYS